MSKISLNTNFKFFLAVGLIFLASFQNCHAFSAGEDVFDLFNSYLRQGEFVGLPFIKGIQDKYPAAVLSYTDFETILKNCTAQYESSGITPKTPSDPDNGFIQKVIVPNESRLIFMGDLHGDIQAMIRMLCKLMAEGELDNTLRLKKPNTYFIFLGDLVDYGKNGADTLTLVALLKLLNPNNVLICRGNHEDIRMCGNDRNGFLNELKARYSLENEHSPLFADKLFQFFSCLPQAIFIGIKGRPEEGFIQCCHGGIDESAKAEIKNLLVNDALMLQNLKTTGINFQWGDFTGLKISSDPQARGFKEGIRGPGIYAYDSAGVERISKTFNILYFFRGHQDQDYAFKNMIEGIDYPTCIHPIASDSETRSDLASCREVQEWRDDTIPTITALWTRGFMLSDLPASIGSVFTFSNASTARNNYDEGFGILTINNRWKNSVLRVFTHRTRTFEQRRNFDLFHMPQFTYINALGESLVYFGGIGSKGMDISEDFIGKVRQGHPIEQDQNLEYARKTSRPNLVYPPQPIYSNKRGLAGLFE